MRERRATFLPHYRCIASSSPALLGPKSGVDIEAAAIAAWADHWTAFIGAARG